MSPCLKQLLSGLSKLIPKRGFADVVLLGHLGPDASKNMVVEVTIGIPQPDQVDEATVLSVLPHGKGVLKVVQGGLEIEGREGSGDRSIMANAAVIAKVDLG